METQITLKGSYPVLSARLLRREGKFLLLSLDYSPPVGGANPVCWLSRIEALTLWNFLDEALEIPLNPGREMIKEFRFTVTQAKPQDDP